MRGLFKLTVICMLCVFVRTGLMRTVRRSPWLLEADRIMITCTECTCPASTAAAAATAARPASLQERTPSATLPLPSTCELHNINTPYTVSEHTHITFTLLWRIHGVFVEIDRYFLLIYPTFPLNRIFILSCSTIHLDMRKSHLSKTICHKLSKKKKIWKWICDLDRKTTLHYDAA